MAPGSSRRSSSAQHSAAPIARAAVGAGQVGEHAGDDRRGRRRAEVALVPRHPGLQPLEERPAALRVELAAAVEDVEEAVAARRPDRTRKWPGHPDALQRDAAPPADLDGEHGQAERDAEPPVEHVREERVRGVVVGVPIAGEARGRRRGGGAAPSKVGSVTPAASASRRRRSASTSRSGRRGRRSSSSASSSGQRLVRAARRAPRSAPSGRRPRGHGTGGYLAAMFPGSLRRHRPRPAGRDHGDQRRGRHLRRARRGGQPALPRVPGRRACSRATTWPCASRTRPASSR